MKRAESMVIYKAQRPFQLSGSIDVTVRTARSERLESFPCHSERETKEAQKSFWKQQPGHHLWSSRQPESSRGKA